MLIRLKGFRTKNPTLKKILIFVTMFSLGEAIVGRVKKHGTSCLRPRRPDLTLMLTGLDGAGKTTVLYALQKGLILFCYGGFTFDVCLFIFFIFLYVISFSYL